MFKYSINLSWSVEDEGYIATIPEFPGLSAFGETPSDAVEEAKMAAEGFIKIYRENGRPLPEPTTLSDFSGQLRIRIPKSLHASLSEEAKKEGISLNTYINHLLSERNAFFMIKKEIRKNTDVFIASALREVGTSGKPLIVNQNDRPYGPTGIYCIPTYCQ